MQDNIKILDKKIQIFRSKFEIKYYPIVFEPNAFDIFINKIFDIANFFYKKYFHKIIIFCYQKMKNLILNIKNTIFNIRKLEQKIDIQEKIIYENIRINNNLSKQILELNNKFNNYLNTKESDKNKNNLDNIKTSNTINIEKKSVSKVDFFQEENMRLNNELFETKKKFDIMKEELSKFESQRSNLISKLNSVNEVIQDANVVTNVFENSVEEKVKIIDHSKIRDNNTNVDLNEAVSKIFSN